MKQMVQWWAVGAWSLILVGVGWLSVAPATQLEEAETAATGTLLRWAQAPNTAADFDALPASQPGILMLEGEPVDVTLTLFREAALPLVTYYPEAMTAESACADEGCSIAFTLEALPNARVHFFLPSGMSTVEALDTFVTGESGLLATNRWLPVHTFAEPSSLRFPWAQKGITFSDPEQARVGVIYIGESEGIAFLSIVIFPPEEGDGFSPYVDAVLSHVRLQSG